VKITIERKADKRGNTILTVNGEVKKYNASDRTIIRSFRGFGEFVKDVTILEYTFDKRVFKVEFTKSFSEAHNNFI